MFGSVRPYHSQVVISTGVSDWEREVTHTNGSLAYFLAQAKGKPDPLSGSPSSDPKKRVNGLFTSADSKKLSILNGSHKSISDNPHHETVLLFPDYKLVTGVDCSQEGAQNLWDLCLRPGRHENASLRSYTMEKSTLNTWVIPYSCVILLCKFILHSIPPLICLIKALTRKEITGVALQRLNLKLVCPISSRSS